MNKLEITAFSPVTGKARKLSQEELSEILLLLADCARALSRGETLESLTDRFADISWPSRSGITLVVRSSHWHICGCRGKARRSTAQPIRAATSLARERAR